jgi:hypothetical protein
MPKRLNSMSSKVLKDPRQPMSPVQLVVLYKDPNMLESVVEESDDSSVVDSEADVVDMVVDVVAVIHVKMVNKTKTKNNTKAMMNNMEMEDHAVVVEVFVDAAVSAMVDLGAVVDAVVSVAPDRTMKMAKRRMVSKEMALLDVAEDAVVVEAEDVVADVAVETKMAVMTNESFETKKILFTYLTPTFVICYKPFYTHNVISIF